VEVSSSVGKQASAGSSSGISPGKTSRIGAFVGEKRSSVTTTKRPTGGSKLKVGIGKTVKSNNSRVVQKSKSIVKQPEKTVSKSQKRIGRTIKVERKADTVAPETRTGGSTRKVGIGKTVKSNNSRVVKKSKSIVKQPEKTVRSSRGRIGRTIKADRKTFLVTAGKVSRDSRLSTDTSRTAETTGARVLRESRTIVKRPEKRIGGGVESHRTRKSTGLVLNNRTSFRKPSLFTRRADERSRRIGAAGGKSGRVRIESRKVFARLRPTISRSRKAIARRRERLGKERFFVATYRERSHIVRHPRRHEHVYVDRHSQIRRRIVRPGYRFAVYYNWGPWFSFRYFYPYYHRKYVFVSLGGYWPVGYRYARYYWYGCHPYRWYGYYPVAYEVGSDTYNYYTYNYYNGGTAGVEPCRTSGDVGVVDHTTFADIRERLAQEGVEEPDEQTLADSYFEDAVKAFEAGDYDKAAELFAKAMELALDDVVLPFAHAQALFAGEKYAEAAEAVRAALVKVSPEKEGVFYPRGLYPKEDILLEQIDRLAERAELYSFDGDLQFLLGYQMLGIGEIDEAVESLQLANQDLENASSAAVLLSLAEKIKSQKAEDSGE
jgi:hypothetical protein